MAKRRLILGILVLALFVAYPLSLGPAAKLADKGVIPNDAVNALYAPVAYLIRRNQTVRAFMWWYLNDLWKVERD